MLYNLATNSYTTIDDPLGVNTGTNLNSSASGINDEGQIVGYYTDSSGVIPESLPIQIRRLAKPTQLALLGMTLHLVTAPCFSMEAFCNTRPSVPGMAMIRSMGGSNNTVNLGNGTDVVNAGDNETINLATEAIRLLR